MRMPVFLLVVAAAGMVAGASLIGRWAVGCAVIVVSFGLAAYALLVDDGKSTGRPNVPFASIPTHQEVLDRVRVMQ